MHAPVEELPPQLNNVAAEIHIYFPWASLLRAVAVGDEEVLGSLRRIATFGALLKVAIGIDDVRDSAEIRRLQLPHLTEEYVRSALMPRYAMSGFDVQQTRIHTHADWPHFDTTWAKRLKNNISRRLLVILAKAASSASFGKPIAGPSTIAT